MTDDFGIIDESKVTPPPRGCAICEAVTRNYTVIMGRDVCDECKGRLDFEERINNVLTGRSEP